MKIQFTQERLMTFEIPDEEAFRIAARVIRSHMGFKPLDSAGGVFVRGENLIEGGWVYGHNRDWEENLLRKATPTEIAAWELIEDFERV